MLRRSNRIHKQVELKCDIKRREVEKESANYSKRTTTTKAQANNYVKIKHTAFIYSNKKAIRLKYFLS